MGTLSQATDLNDALRRLAAPLALELLIDGNARSHHRNAYQDCQDGGNNPARIPTQNHNHDIAEYCITTIQTRKSRYPAIPEELSLTMSVMALPMATPVVRTLLLLLLLLLLPDRPSALLPEPTMFIDVPSNVRCS